MQLGGMIHRIKLFGRNSFIPYARRTPSTLRSINYVESGDAFESTVQERLQSWGINLSKTGGPHDKGIDLEGAWELDKDEDNNGARTLSTPVLVQCKNECKKTGVGELRSLDGALIHRRNRTRRKLQQSPLGIFASSSGFTRPAIEYVCSYSYCISKGGNSSTICCQACRLHTTLESPMALCGVDIEGRIFQFLMNNAAQALLPECTVVDRRQLAHLISDKDIGVAIAYRGRLLY